jgi:hypothetical protein
VFHTAAVTDDQIHSQGLHNYVTSATILAAIRLRFRLSQFHIDVMTVRLDAASFAVLPGHLFLSSSQFLRLSRMVDFPISSSQMIKFTLTGLSAQSLYNPQVTHII